MYKFLYVILNIIFFNIFVKSIFKVVELDVKMYFNDSNYKVKIRISYDIEKINNTLRIINPPLAYIHNLYNDLPEEISIPEDIIKISQNIKFNTKVE